ncbi:lysozyme [Bacteroidales bacterium OttesenSCG-928-I21]|nr:lysozyme [Bacteroidales bacterium OttesenSCG-928-I21]
MVKKIGNKGKSLIKSFEGLKLTSYLCPAGVWTIGYGHTQGVTSGQIITKQQADDFFDSDIEKFEKAVADENLDINQNQFDALVSFAFNAGASAFKKSTLLKKIKENPNNPEIETEFMKWVNAGGRYLAGLAKRREAEAKLYFS